LGVEPRRGGSKNWGHQKMRLQKDRSSRELNTALKRKRHLLLIASWGGGGFEKTRRNLGERTCQAPVVGGQAGVRPEQKEGARPAQEGPGEKRNGKKTWIDEGVLGCRPSRKKGEKLGQKGKSRESKTEPQHREEGPQPTSRRPVPERVKGKE